ncbi:MAG: chorismate synthase [Candidatus Helarchaeota archaeon]
MAGNTFGKVFKVTTWGESHGTAVGVIIDGCPANVIINKKFIQKELNRRRPGQNNLSSPREELDQVEIMSGIFEGKTTGTPICFIIYNMDVDSTKYEKIKNLLRPSHADFTYFMKYGNRDWRGGGRASGRETVGRVVAGAVAKQILQKRGIEIVGYVKELGGLRIKSYNQENINKNPIRCPDEEIAKKMSNLIRKVKQEGDSIGGIVEIIVKGVPPGLGEPVFDKLSADIAKGLMSIGSVKGIEIGSGFEGARMRGSEHNDEFFIENGKIKLKTNFSGGILGGISTGEEINVRIAVKPIASILKKQQTVNIKTFKAETISVEGRHDVTSVIRIIPVAEAMMAIVILDHLLRNELSRIENIY